MPQNRQISAIKALLKLELQIVFTIVALVGAAIFAVDRMWYWMWASIIGAAITGHNIDCWVRVLRNNLPDILKIDHS